MPLFGDMGSAFNTALKGEFGEGAGEDLLLGAVLIGAGAALGGPAGASIGASVGGSIVQQRQQRKAEASAKEQGAIQAQEAQTRQNDLIKKQFQQKKVQNLSPAQEGASKQGTVLTPTSDEGVSLLG